jgi:NAD(P)H-flavin reductase
LREGTRRVLMVAGGTGVAPMVSMLRQMIRSQQPRAVTLCFGVNETTDLFRVDELRALAKSLPHFDLHIAVARGSSSRVYHSGLVTDLIGGEGLADTDIYLCGPPAMTDCARTIVVNRGAAASSIFSEKFLSSARDDSEIAEGDLSSSDRTVENWEPGLVV